MRNCTHVAASRRRRYATSVRGRDDADFSRFSAIAATTAITAALVVCGCPRAKQPPPSPTSTAFTAQPASGDFDWSIDDQRHPLRAGAAFFGAGGSLELVLADADVATPCDAKKLAADPERGVERVRVHLPRGLDVDWPIGHVVSPGTLQLHPLDRSKINAGGRIVPRYELELSSIEVKPGGRVIGRLAWVGQPKDAAHGVDAATLGEGQFDVPLCATQPEIDAVVSTKPRPIDPPSTPAQGSTTTGAFTSARAFAVLRSWYGLTPHPARIELYTDPLVDCGTRATAKGTSLLVDLDAGTALGRHNGTRQPIGAVECVAGTTKWDCMGDAASARGFIEVRESDLRIGGRLRGVIAIAGPSGALVQGAFDAQLCAPD
jgi:hypothetical protein